MLMQIEMRTYIYVKYSDIKVYENASSGSRSVACRQTDGDKATRCFLNIFLRKRLKEVLAQPVLM
jgi:hypothetical protein